MTVVAIHQPNYAPWLGYFNKIARADCFVFLDDVQFSKGSYINRVQILGAEGGRWLTQPVSVSLGMAIKDVPIARSGWTQSHLDVLRGQYRSAAAFTEVWPALERLYAELPCGDLAAVNEHLIKALSSELGLHTRFFRSSEIDTGTAERDDRLVAIVSVLTPDGIYLSGKGGGSYQDPTKFRAVGLELTYTDFAHPVYQQGRTDFISGLSVLDAVFHLGWDRTAALIRA